MKIIFWDKYVVLTNDRRMAIVDNVGDEFSYIKIVNKSQNLIISMLL